MATSRVIALISIFAAMYYVASILPGIPIVGIPQGKIQLEASLGSVYGIALGPWIGGLATLAGTIVSFILPPGSPGPAGLIFLLNSTLNAVVSGLIYRGKGKYSMAIIAALSLLFLATPICTPIGENLNVAALTLWDKAIALALIPVSGFLERRGYRSATYFTIAFAGVEADHILGCDIFAFKAVHEGIFGLTTEATRNFYIIVGLTHGIERLAMAFIGGLITIPIVMALRNIGWLPSKRES